jgi:hypothetical protein
MRKLFILLVIIFTVFSCTENGTSGGGTGSSGSSKSSEVIDENIVCDKSLKVLPIDKPIAMIIKEHLSFGRKLYAVYPARVDPVTALENYTYDGVYYAQNTHDYETSVKYDVIETFDTITEMAKKGVIVAPQILTAKFRVTLTHYSENSNALYVYVRAKGSSDEWKTIILGGVGTNYVYVETNATGELEYYVEESSFRDWIDDETAEPGVHVWGFVEANIEIEQVYLPFK